MAVTDYKFPGTAASVDRDEKVKWETPDNAKADDTNYATSGGSKNTYTDWLRLTNFGFSSSDIPDGSTINGIEFEINRYCDAGESFSVNDSALYLYANGQVGNNLASATKWPTSVEAATYGGATDMCGTTLSQADIVANTFGVQLSTLNSATSVTAYVDYIKIRVYYTESGGGGIVVPVFLYHYMNHC